MATAWENYKFHRCSMMIVVLTVGCLLTVVNSQQEYYSSMSGLEKLLDTEMELLDGLRHYMEQMQRQIESFESEIARIEAEHLLANSDRENYLTSPVNAFRLIKRLYLDWDTYESRIRKDNIVEAYLNKLTAQRQQLNFPLQNDIEGSAMALARLQETYQLNVAEVAAGILNGVKYGTDMTWQDCFMLGQQLFNVKDYNHTKPWFQESLTRLHQEKYHHEPQALAIMELVAEQLFFIGDFEAALNVSEHILTVNNKRNRAWDIKIASIEAANSKQPVQKPLGDSSFYHSTEEFRIYNKLCRGEMVPTPSQQRNLRCRLLTNGQPYRVLAPFKVEEHSLDPLVLTFHELFSNDTKIETVQQLARPRMHRSTVRSIIDGHLAMTTEYRISKNAWLPYDEHPYLQQMLHELHDASLLDTSHCEELQVANYGLGGHYEPHWDFFTNQSIYPISEIGNRIATAIFYLSDVEQGGATAFPFLRFAVQPKKGNMLFWSNLHRSLDLDYRTKHAGCPVLKGSKWIANIWVHEIQQIFTRPCLLQRDNQLSLDYQHVR